MFQNREKLKKTKRVAKPLKAIPLSKQEKKENFVYFNVIKGVIKKYNVFKNEFNDYILILKCLNYKSLNYTISIMYDFEIQIFVLNNEYYVSLKFDQSFIKGKKNEIFKNVITELKLRSTEYKILNIYEIVTLLRNKVYRNDILKKAEIRNIFKRKNYIELLQNKIFAKNVVIKDDYIYFNYNKNDNHAIKHKIIGLQMYPSYLYEGFLTEINGLDDIETTTYIKTINLEKVKSNLGNENNHIISEYINNIDRLYNTCFFIHLYGTEEQIINKRKIISDIANKYHVVLNEFFMQQKKAFSAFLPLMNNSIKCYRAISNIKGILPFNEDIIKYFKCNMKYGTELLSDKTLYYNRESSGIILSSNKESKRRFIQNERNYVTVDLRLKCKVIDFSNEDINDNNYKNLFTGKLTSISSSEYYKIFKMYCLLCVGAYRENNTIDIGDKELLFEKISKIEEKKNEYNFSEVKELLLSQLDKNKILLKKINKHIDDPTNDIKSYLNNIFKIYLSFDSENKEYIYVYNIQRVINCLDLLLKEVLERKTNNLYLLSSYNDFQLLNNIDVANELFKAPYINIIDIKPNDLVFINNYMNLPNKDLVHLRNKGNITGALYTDMCEFNYYIKRSEDEDDI